VISIICSEEKCDPQRVNGREIKMERLTNKNISANPYRMIVVHNQSKWLREKRSEFHTLGSFAFSFFASSGNHDTTRMHLLNER